MDKKLSLWKRLTGLFRRGRTQPAELTCAEVRELGSDYLEHNPQADSANSTLFEMVRRHLEACSACRLFLEGLRRTVSMLRQLPPAQAPDSLRKQILNRTTKS